MLLTGIGCETEPSSQISIAVTPNTAELKLGESQEFIASGWEDYTWSLAKTNIGVLSTKTGDRTVYTAVTDSNAVQTLTVSALSSTDGVAPGEDANNDGRISAEALIQHVP